MQFKGLALVASAFVFAACGGGADSVPASEAAPAPAAEAAPAATTPAGGAVALAPITGTTHEIKMVGDDKGYRFEPANITIKAGDGVKFVFVSGGPHNVAFDPAKLDAETKAQLDANLGSERMSELMSNMYMSAGEGVTVSFANIKPGAYDYNCTPHIAMGMKGVITVQ
jgi:plastocyanin